MKLANTNKTIDVIFNREIFNHDRKSKIVAHNNEMCATIFLLVVVFSQCLFKEDVYIRSSFASECFPF